MWSIIGTWEMSYDGVKKGAMFLKEKRDCKDAVEEGIKIVENNPEYRSVGFGGLPNEEGVVELDAAFMDGKSLKVGAIAAIRDFENPISIARKLSGNRYNIFLVGEGAEKYALENGFIKKEMLTEEAKKIWLNKKEKLKKLSSYDGHDTVCMIALDRLGDMAVGTSTSGLFMKKSGRVGDSPLIGSGFYIDNEIGGAAATGLGEDIMKGCLSYEVVQRMKRGYSPMEAAQSAVDELVKKLGEVGGISIIAMNNKGEWGVGTNIEFPFCVGNEKEGVKKYIATIKSGGVEIEKR